MYVSKYSQKNIFISIFVILVIQTSNIQKFGDVIDHIL